MRVSLAAAMAASGLGLVVAGPALAHSLPRLPPATGLHSAHGHRVGWNWPLAVPAGAQKPTIVRGFEPPAHRWESGHRGVDLLAAVGQDVLAAGSGTVSYAGPLFGRPVVAIDHTAPGHDTLRTTYEPVEPVVKVGDKVKAGQVVGKLGADATDPDIGHCAPRACLHWGLVRGFGHAERYLDPSGLLDHGPVRLLPVWGVR
jgi:murein DD-endopeptidase MepM/ murein hydrolase activator NlpD